MIPGVVDFLRGFLPVRSREPFARPGADRVASIQSFQPVGLQDFLALQVPRREMLLAPILPERSLAMLYAPRGIGKSWLGLTIGLAVASGGPFSIGMRLGLAGSFLLMAKWCFPIFRSD
jgi:hypothetical protein